jgi:hypothetical protein
MVRWVAAPDQSKSKENGVGRFHEWKIACRFGYFKLGGDKDQLPALRQQDGPVALRKGP